MRLKRTALDVKATESRIGLAKHLLTCGMVVALAALEPVGTMIILIVFLCWCISRAE